MIKAGAYVHIPYCRKKCDYCAFTSTAGAVPEEYISALIKEITGSVYTDLVFDTVFFGGGTPSLLPEGATARILDAIRSTLKTDLVEVTVEGNPESLTEAKLKELKSAGVNRISIGVQSLDDGCLAAIGRIHDSACAMRALERATRLFDNVSADVMLGLPARKDLGNELNALFTHPISHLSAYMLTVEDGTRLASAVKACEVTLPSEDEAVEEYDLTKAICALHGMHRYEVSNFSKAGKECRHNLKYWRREPYVGFGVAAHSQAYDRRFFNVDDTCAYIGGRTLAGTEVIPEGEAMFETVMLGLRLDEGVSRQAFKSRFGVDVCERYNGAISRTASMLDVTDDYVKVRPEYTCVLNSILVEFMD